MNKEAKALVKELKMNSENGIKVSSRQVAEKFGKAHRTVIRSIQTLECSEEFTRNNFVQSDFVTDRGRTFTEYMMTRDGFSFLCMGFTGKEAAAWKETFIAAFNMMEQELLKQRDKLEWKAARNQIRAVRQSFTDIVKDFVEYAKEQGSSSAERYYANLTKMEYAALDLVSYSDKVPPNFRDTLDLMDLGFLTAAEQVCRRAIAEGMNQKLHYKDIYTYAKNAVNKYAEAIKLPEIGHKK